jgi:glycosyltransferase involved in cell wall biosynthesis
MRPERVGAPMNLPSVSVIIPTSCSAARAPLLVRAIGSVVAQRGVATEIVVVANGPAVDERSFAALRADARLRVERLAVGSAPRACRHGRGIATGEFFCFLDDDDEYLPGALAARLAPLVADPELDFVVTDGYGGDGAPMWSNVDVGGIRRDPLGSLMRSNWLASCGALFRSRSVGVEQFDGLARMVEWTMLAYRLVAGGFRFALLEERTFRLGDTPGSLSKTFEYQLGTIEMLRLLLDDARSAPVRDVLQRKLADSMHLVADVHRVRGEWLSAWGWHLRSLARRGGLRYASFTARLVAAMVLPASEL